MPAFRRVRTSAWVLGLTGLSAIGCGGPAAPSVPAPADKPAVAAATPALAAEVPAAEPTSPVSVAVAPEAKADPKFTQSFAEATAPETPDGVQLPADRTLAGKSTGAIREAVEKAWAGVPLTDAAGKPLNYVAAFETSHGTFEVALKADAAPNHVRNLVALVRAGYYDGLTVDRLVHQEATGPDGTKTRLQLVKFGCPEGTGDEGKGHVGYFLRPEFSETVKHEAGTVGFWREDAPDSAGTRLYVTLGAAPVLDGSFTAIGTVAAGLDVVQRIAAQETKGENVYPDVEIPKTPIAIRKATVRVAE